MPAFVAKYSPEQRQAVENGKLERNLTYQRIVELAAAGELIKGEPFEIPIGYVGHLCRAAMRRRLGKIKTGLASQPPRDAREVLRQELVNMAAAEIAVEKAKKAGKRDPERMRQLARAVREIEQIKGATEPDPPSPATRDANGHQHGPTTKGGLAGALVKDHRRSAGGEPAQDATPTPTPHRDSEGRGDAPRQTGSATEQGEGSPGSWATEQVAVLGAREVELG